MTDERTPLEAALDLFVFAPVGAFLTLTEDLPKLVERGKGHLQSQLGMARMMGEMAAPQLKDEATKLVKGFMDRVAQPPAPPAARPTAPKPTPPKPASPSTPPAPAPEPEPAPAPSSAPASRTSAPGAAGIANPDTLAIPGYDSLSAMQVVQRLAGLTTRELDAVRRYEDGHRRRKTIINRAEQLLAEAG